MGTFFNPDNESFKQAVRSRIYVDKTGLLEELNRILASEEKCIALSHARRFGKSQAAAMIDAYYSLGSDSRELFLPYKIAKENDFEEHLNQYNVIHMDISSIADFHKEDLVETIIGDICDDFAEEYDDVDCSKDINKVIMQVYKKTGIKFIIIFDEWDCVVRNHADRPDLVHDYLQLLHSLFKSEESKHFLALAYITGILPIKKIKDESALNNFREFTMISSKNLTEYFGFTEDEVRELCRQYGMNFESVKEWYNGYLIGKKHMYNPNSVYQAMIDHDLNSYWKNTSAFESINTYITLDYDGLKEDVINMLSGGRVPVNVHTFSNDLSIIHSKDEALTALIHLGYLGYDMESEEAYIPNYEVALTYQAALAVGGWSEISKTISRCQELLMATIRKQSETVAELVELAHEAYTSILKYNDENALSCCITMAYFTAPAYYNVIREFPSGKGFADIVFLPRVDTVNKPAMIIELKYENDADSAIRQIKEKRYAGQLKGYGKEILLVGISYGKDKKHECMIESVDNEAYNYDEETGKITRNEAYDGCNALFKLPLDAKKADPKKAESYLKSLDKTPEEEQAEMDQELENLPESQRKEIEEGEPQREILGTFVQTLTVDNIDELCEKVEGSEAVVDVDWDSDWVEFSTAGEAGSSGGMVMSEFKLLFPDDAPRISILNYGISGGGADGTVSAYISVLRRYEDGTITCVDYVPKDLNL